MSKKIDFLKSIESLSAADLEAKIREDEQRIQKMHFAHSVSPLENPQTLRSMRRDIARMKTQLRKIQMGI
jgi:large subunit ribosomal protein L29